MSKPAKYRFLMRTEHRSGQLSEELLAQTDSQYQAQTVRHKIKMACTGAEAGNHGNNAPVVIMRVNAVRFVTFNRDPNARPRPGQRFKSVNALALAIGAHPSTLRSALSNAKKNSLPHATSRGISYAYAEK